MKFLTKFRKFGVRKFVAPVLAAGVLVLASQAARADDPVTAPTVTTIVQQFTDTVYPWVAPVVGVMIVLFAVFLGIAWLMRGTRHAK